MYDGSDIVLVTDETGAITHRYLHGPAIDQIFADEQLGEDVRWALSDNQGTVCDWVVEDTTTGTTSIVDHLDYNAYGQITGPPDPQNSNQASTDEIHSPHRPRMGRGRGPQGPTRSMRTRLFPVNKQSISTSLGFSQGNELLVRRERQLSPGARDPCEFYSKTL